MTAGFPSSDIRFRLHGIAAAIWIQLAVLLTCGPVLAQEAGVATAEIPANLEEEAAAAPVARPVEETVAEDEDSSAGADEDPDEEPAGGEEAPAVARPVTADPVQVFGWREWVYVGGEKGGRFLGKLDTGAHTSSIHAENDEMFERDGEKWVRFDVVQREGEEVTKVRLEAPLVRTTRIKRPGGKSQQRNVVRLSYRIGDRRIRGEFTLNDRHNMVAPILIGRSGLKILGWVDSERTFLADRKIFR